MRTQPFPYLFFSFAAVILTPAITPAYALEAPADNATPPPMDSPVAAKLPDIDLNLDKAPTTKPTNIPDAPAAGFLGVVSSDVPEALADHLNLKHGEGIIVRSLVPDGPAATSGITVNDVILSVNGQAVGSPSDLSQEIMPHKPGDTVALRLIHKGKDTEVKVALGSRPTEIASHQPQAADQMSLEGLPKELADRIRDSIAGNLGGMNLQLQSPGATSGGIQFQSNSTVKLRDDQGSVEMKSKDGSKEVTIKNQAGEVLWTGPWDTDQDKSAAPAELRQRVENLQLDSGIHGNGLRLQMRQSAPEVADE